MVLPTQPVLFFDLGGVLIENQRFSEHQRLLNTQQSQAELVELWLANPVAREYELGRCSTDDFSRSIIEELQLSLTPEEFLVAFREWPKGFYPGVDSMLQQLRAQATVCCLSNSNEAHWTEKVTSHFDHAFSSHLIGRIKPDRDAFEHVLGVLDVAAKDVIYFDDAESNVEAGSHAWHKRSSHRWLRQFSGYAYSARFSDIGTSTHATTLHTLHPFKNLELTMAKIQRLYPTGMGFCQVVVGTGQRHIHVSGQVAIDATGKLIGEGDLVAQTRQVMKNLERGLMEASATFDDLVKMTVFVVNYDPSMRARILEVRHQFIAKDAGPASTLIGVQSLVAPEFLIEIEGYAVTD